MQINEIVWRPSRVQAMTGLSVEQVFELADRVEDYLDGWQPVCGRRRAIGLFEAIVATLFYYRHNQSQQVTAAVFGISQPTVSRIVTAVEEPIAAVCDPQVPKLVELLAGRVILTDGTLIPTGHRAGHRELYSGTRRRAGAAAQVLSDTEGQLRHVSEPMAGSVLR